MCRQVVSILIKDNGDVSGLIVSINFVLLMDFTQHKVLFRDTHCLVSSCAHTHSCLRENLCPFFLQNDLIIDKNFTMLF